MKEADLTVRLFFLVRLRASGFWLWAAGYCATQNRPGGRAPA